MMDSILIFIGFLTKLMILGMLFIIPIVCIIWDKKNDRKRKANRLYDKK